MSVPSHLAKPDFSIMDNAVCCRLGDMPIVYTGAGETQMIITGNAHYVAYTRA